MLDLHFILVYLEMHRFNQGKDLREQSLEEQAASESFTDAFREPGLNLLTLSGRRMDLEGYHLSYMGSESSLQWLTPSLTLLEENRLQ